VYRVSGPGRPQRAAPASPAAPRAHPSLPWAIGGLCVVALSALAAWRLGWLSFGAPDRAAQSAATSVVASAPAPPPPPPQRVAPAPPTADADGVTEEALAALARERVQAEAARAAKTQADAEAAANRVRAAAVADAARIRGEAQAAAARTRSDAAAATRDAPAPPAPALAATVAHAADPTAGAPAGAAARSTRFDGAWSVSVVCEPMGPGAAGYQFDFVAQVQDNFLRGERRAQGSPGWLRLEGAIQPDGSATLDAHGLTDDPKYSNGVAHGTPYAYHVAARFDADRGTGRRMEMRACDLHFAKQ
jgi:hypothetical protein